MNKVNALLLCNISRNLEFYRVVVCDVVWKENPWSAREAALIKATRSDIIFLS